MSSESLREAIITEFRSAHLTGRVYQAPVAWDTPEGAEYHATKAFAECLANAIVADFNASILWQDYILDFHDPGDGLPVNQATGARYIATSTANGWTINDIYEYNGSSWDQIIPGANWCVWVLSMANFYLWNETEWGKWEINYGLTLNTVPMASASSTFSDSPITVTGDTVKIANLTSDLTIGASGSAQYVNKLRLSLVGGYYGGNWIFNVDDGYNGTNLLIGYGGETFFQLNANHRTTNLGLGAGTGANKARVSVGPQSPTGFLDIEGSTTSYPQVVLRDGALVTTPVDGGFERSGSSLYFTNAALTRLGLITNTGASLTTGYIPKASSATTLANSPIFTDGVYINIGTTNSQTEKVVISGGNLSIEGSAQPSLHLRNSSANDWMLQMEGNDFGIWNDEYSAYNLYISKTTGNVGIKNLNPSYILSIGGASPTTYGLEPSDNYTVAQVGALTFRPHYMNDDSRITCASIVMQRTSTTNNQYDGIIQFYTRKTGGSLTEAARIDPSGNIGIGYTSPLSTLCVNGGVNIGSQVSTGTHSLRVSFDDTHYANMSVDTTGNMGITTSGKINLNSSACFTAPISVGKTLINTSNGGSINFDCSVYNTLQWCPEITNGDLVVTITGGTPADGTIIFIHSQNQNDCYKITMGGNWFEGCCGYSQRSGIIKYVAYGQYWAKVSDFLGAA